MIEDLEKEFSEKMHEVESLRQKGIHTIEHRKLIRAKERELIKLEDDIECAYTLEMEL